MVEAARDMYPASQYPALSFDVADCSDPDGLPLSEPFDVVFAGWLLNYAGSERELENMFRVVAKNLKREGRFVGVTTNAHDPWMKEDKRGFYGLDVEVLEREYVAPDTGREVCYLILWLQDAFLRSACTVQHTVSSAVVFWSPLVWIHANRCTGRHQSTRNSPLHATLLLRRIPVPERGVRKMCFRSWAKNPMGETGVARRHEKGNGLLARMGPSPNLQRHRSRSCVKTRDARALIRLLSHYIVISSYPEHCTASQAWPQILKSSSYLYTPRTHLQHLHSFQAFSTHLL